MTAALPPDPTRVDAATARLYSLLPAHIRTTDAAHGRALLALCQVLSTGAVEIDTEIDTLYDAMFVETAPEGALDDIGALVAAQPLQPLPPGSGYSARAFIANTVRYRRGKGTARVLEALAADVGGFGAVAVEYFMRLARTQNLIDVRPERPGTAMLVPGESAARAGTGFDAMARLVDVRSIARAKGRHHVPHVGVHIVRPVVPHFPAPSGELVDADDIAGVPQMRGWPDAGGTVRPGYFQLAAQPGRVLRLFNPDPAVTANGERTGARDLRDRLRRLPLHLETQELRHAALEGRPPALGEDPWFAPERPPFALFARAVGASLFRRVPPEQIRIANLDALPAPPGARPAALATHHWFEGGSAAPIARSGDAPIACGFDPATGRLIVAAPTGGAADIEEVRVAYGTGIGRAIGAGPQERNDAGVPFDLTDTDTLRHFIRVVDGKPAAMVDGIAHVPTLAAALADWATGGAGMRGVIVLIRCDRETAAGPIAITAHPGCELHIVAARWQAYAEKPGLPPDPRRKGFVIRNTRRFTLDAPVEVVAGAAPPAGGRAGVVVIDGLELTQGLTLKIRAVSRLWLRHVTLRRPGAAALSTTAPLNDCDVVLDSAIVGRLNLDFGSDPAAGRLVVTDSIVSADEAAGPAVTASSIDAVLTNVTLLGTSRFKTLEATNVLFTGASEVTRKQEGCVRYSYVAPGSAMPRRFRCQPDLVLAAAAAKKGSALNPPEKAAASLAVVPLFLDTAIDEPTVAMLHPLCADGIRLGGENDSEMGAFSIAAEGLRVANVRSLFDDFVPFGMEAAVRDDTRSSAVVKRRIQP